MRARLLQWFRDRHALFPDESLTQVNDWTPAMVGKFSAQKLKTKASETWSLLLFLLDTLQTFGERASGDAARLLDAGRCLEHLVLLWKRSSWVLPAAALQVHVAIVRS